jgi:hypothetical protein
MSIEASTYKHPRHVRLVLESLVPVLCPPEATELGLAGKIVDHAEQTMGVLPSLFRAGLLAGLTTYDQSARLWPTARGKAAHDLPLHLRSRWYLRWLGGMTPVQREFAKAVKQVIVLAHYEQPEIQERIGYKPQQWIDQVKKRRLEVYTDDIARHEASITAPDPLPRQKRPEVV